MGIEDRVRRETENTPSGMGERRVPRKWWVKGHLNKERL